MPETSHYSKGNQFLPFFLFRKVKTVISCQKPHIGEEVERDFILLDTSLNILQLGALELNTVNFKTCAVKCLN